MKKQAADGRKQTAGRRRRVFFSCRLPSAVRGLRRFLSCLLLSVVCLLFCSAVHAQVGDYERRSVASVEVVLEGTPADPSAQAEFLSIVRIRSGGEYTAVAARQSLHDLFASDRVANGRIEVTEVQPGSANSPIRVRFVITRQLVVAGVTVRVGEATGVPIATDEIRARLNLLEPGRRFSSQAIERNADEIQAYLRDRGYYNATVEHSEEPDPTDSTGTRRRVIYAVTPGEPARVATFDIAKELNVEGAAESVRPTLKLQPGALFTRDILGEDVNRIRQALLAKGFLSPTLKDPRVERNPETNEITVSLEGSPGPFVNIAFKNYNLKEKTQRELLPLKREGNLDISVIEEGGRRVRNRLQEDGYFFAEVTALCTVTPAAPTTVANGTNETCQNLVPEGLTGHTVTVTYDVTLNRRLKLTDIRITGTDNLAPEDIYDYLKSRKANALSFLPFIGGLGRGFTSNAMLEEDRRTVDAYMTELGYRAANVTVLQGISLTGEDLIITFNVEEGPLTRIAETEVRGATVFDQGRLQKEITIVKQAPYSRSQVRGDAARLLNLYAREGYIEADIRVIVDELPKQGDDEQVRVVFNVTKEGAKAIVNDILVNGVTGSAGTQRKKRDAIIRAVPLHPGDPLRADRITEAERALYMTDAFRQVLISQQPAGETPTGEKKYDVVIDVEETKPRVIEYGGGFSTDTGALGLMELTNVNFMNKLRTAAIRLRGSQRQQIVRLEFLDPRFARYRKDQFAPLALSLQYFRDSTITRFFRSTIDRGTFGIVQRLDADGNPIDVFGNRVGEPEIDRLTFTAETQRVLSQQRHSLLFLRYTYEDVRLRNIESLLLKDILIPDQVVRMSRFGTSFVVDTRERCERRLPGVVVSGEDERIRSGEVCRYNQTDATRGHFLSADFSWAAKALGGNTSFMKFLSTYRTYYKVGGPTRGTVLAANVTVGLAQLFDVRDRNGNGRLDDFDRLLPISERFFSGGSTTLRGYKFEEAGPRQVIVPQGQFRDREGNLIGINPFTVPIGGNAEVVANLEARIPLTRDVQIVPFYDGGNVFRSIGDIFSRKPITPSGNFVEDVNAQNLRVRWSHTVGLGFRFKTPLGGALAIDYGFLLNPSRFLIPQNLNTLNPTTTVFQIQKGQFQFRFSQTF
ncbi:MAG TPA: POTRA domain-containing protein [Pyrinomonadaceae bacterium]|nr:POTRA domain-containing protein [Pyrinomonadaceae bacterium]